MLLLWLCHLLQVWLLQLVTIRLSSCLDRYSTGVRDDEYKPWGYKGHKAWTLLVEDDWTTRLVVLVCHKACTLLLYENKWDATIFREPCFITAMYCTMNFYLFMMIFSVFNCFAFIYHLTRFFYNELTLLEINLLVEYNVFDHLFIENICRQD